MRGNKILYLAQLIGNQNLYLHSTKNINDKFTIQYKIRNNNWRGMHSAEPSPYSTKKSSFRGYIILLKYFMDFFMVSLTDGILKSLWRVSLEKH